MSNSNSKLRTPAKPVDSAMNVKESEASLARTKADLQVPDPTPEKANAFFQAKDDKHESE